MILAFLLGSKLHDAWKEGSFPGHDATQKEYWVLRKTTEFPYLVTTAPTLSNGIVIK